MMALFPICQSKRLLGPPSFLDFLHEYKYQGVRVSVTVNCQSMLALQHEEKVKLFQEEFEDEQAKGCP